MIFVFIFTGMDEMEFTEAESNLNDLISEYQQYQVNVYLFIFSLRKVLKLFFFLFISNVHL